jgi:hypothetical protein
MLSVAEIWKTWYTVLLSCLGPNPCGLCVELDCSEENLFEAMHQEGRIKFGQVRVDGRAVS